MTGEWWSEGHVRGVYDAVAEDYGAQFPTTEPEAAVDLATIDHFVEQLAETTDAPRVLDAGCGTGRMSRYLADRGCRVVGVDLSPGMVAVGRRVHPDIDAHVASICALPFADDAFDALFSWYSVIHLPDDAVRAALAEARRVVRAGGQVLVGSQSGEGTRDVGSAYRRFGHDVELTRFRRTADTISQLLAEAGIVETARLERAARPGERDDQAFVIGRAEGLPNASG